ncbi:MAG: flagellar motor switch protein FliM [Dehalococcoidia bacterium]
MALASRARGESLSQAKIEELLASLTLDQDGSPAVAAPANEKPIRTWDFRKPDKFSKDHLRSLLALHQSFSRVASTALSARLRTNVTLRVTSVDQGLYEEYIDLLPEHSLVNIVSLKPLDGSVLLEFQPNMAIMMIDRLLGGSGSAVDPNHELTDIELALVRNLVRTLLDAYQEAWLNLVETDPVLEEISNSPQIVHVAAATDIVVIVLLEAQIGDRPGTFSICVPHVVLEPIMQRLSAQVWATTSRRRHVPPEIREQLSGGIRKASVNLTAILGETRVTVDEVVRLQVGDVLMLNPGSVQQARLQVGDQVKFAGQPGVVGGRMAVKITGVEGDDGGDE